MSDNPKVFFKILNKFFLHYATSENGSIFVCKKKSLIIGHPSHPTQQ